jgi:hypothetical protein
VCVPRYLGGTPGPCRFRWFRVPDATGVPELLNPGEPDLFEHVLGADDVNTRVRVAVWLYSVAV